MAETTPYGEWPSPIDAATVAGDSIDFGGVTIEDGTVYWLERRPDEGGRGVICRAGRDGDVEAVSPDDVDVRTTVHEYGGGDFTVLGETVVFSRFDDQRLYRLEVDGSDDAEPTPMTPEPPEPSAHRYADMEATPDGDRLYCVRERHDTEDEPRNELVTLPVDGTDTPTVVASGHDFYATPRVNPDGTHLAWLTWDHPQMPWDGTTLHVAAIAADGTLGEPRTVMGGPEESVFQPTWAPDGTLYAVSDRTGWWNVYEFGSACDDLEPKPVREEAAEYGTPQWVFGTATVAPLSDGTLVTVRNRDGSQDLGLLDPGTGSFEPADIGFSVFPHPRLATDGESVATVAAGPATPPSVITWSPGEDPTVHRRAFELPVEEEYVSRPDHVTFPTGPDGTEEAHGFYYPPVNPDVDGPDEDQPPLLVKVHGGPTSQTLPVANLEIQYYTTRGFAVMDVNYRGSTGYGRAYRDRLDGTWGEVDTEDCVAAARFLADRGDVDPDRLAITGGSAGGYAVLCALAFHDTFDAGASYYGVGDLRALARDTHKFESRYLDSLVGPLPEAEEIYEARSPTVHATDISTPLLVLQGGEDRVVPPAQAETLVEGLVEAGTPYAYLEFPEERHGFRSAAARERALETEFTFYGEVFGFTPAGDMPSLELDRGEYRKRTPE